jgi:hypothetical protein
VTDTDSRRALVDVAAAWASGLTDAERVVDVATDALVAGVESTSLVLLAGTPKAQAAIEVPELLPRAMDELRLPFFGWDHPSSRLLGAAALAREHLHHRLPARDLCRMIHARFGHQAHDLIEPLAMLDDGFDIGYQTEEELERETLVAASELVAFADALNPLL